MEVWPSERHLPHELVPHGLAIAAEQPDVLPHAEVKWRPQLPRPALKVVDFGPGQAFPGGDVLAEYVGVEDDQIQHKQHEDCLQHNGQVAEPPLLVLQHHSHGQDSHRREEQYLAPQVAYEVLLVPLTDAVADPGAMVIEGRDAPLALSAVLHTQRLLVHAFAAVAELNVHSPLRSIPLHGALVFGRVVSGRGKRRRHRPLTAR